MVVYNITMITYNIIVEIRNLYMNIHDKNK